MFWLRVVADGLTLLACAAACVVLGRLVWLMRRHASFRTAAVGLMLVLAMAGAKRLLDLMGYRVGSPGESSTILGLSSLVLAGGVALLLPMLYQVKAFGEAAELAHERFVSAAETGRQAFFILESERSRFNKTGDFRFSFVNANAEKLLLHRNRDLIGMPLTQALPTLPESTLVERLRQVERTGLPYSGEIRYSNDSGDDLWFEIQAVKMQHGVAVTLYDLSAERSGQRQVEQMHRFSRSLIHDAPFAILTTDTSGTITAMNPAAERLTGFSATPSSGTPRWSTSTILRNCATVSCATRAGIPALLLSASIRSFCCSGIGPARRSRLALRLPRRNPDPGARLADGSARGRERDHRLSHDRLRYLGAQEAHGFDYIPGAT